MVPTFAEVKGDSEWELCWPWLRVTATLLPLRSERRRRPQRRRRRPEWDGGGDAGGAAAAEGEGEEEEGDGEGRCLEELEEGQVITLNIFLIDPYEYKNRLFSRREEALAYY